MRGNTITMHLARGRVSQTGSLFQYDYGQKLIFAGVELPQSYEVHFSNEPQGNCKTMLGDATGVEIPDEYLKTGENIHVFIYLHNTEDDGETEYHGVINVQKRGKPTDQPPTPEQQTIIEQAISALENAVEGIPGEIDTALAEAKASGEFDGADGYSPTVTVEDISGGHRVTITDAEGDHSFDVMDGQGGGGAVIDDNSTAADKVWSAQKVNGVKNTAEGKYSKPSGGIPSSDMSEAVQTSLGKADTAYQKPVNGIPAEDIASGVIPDPTSIIDDTAGDGDTNKVWSADKSADLMSAIDKLTPDATAGDVGKAIIVKTVEDGKPTAYEYGEAGGGSIDPQDIADAVDEWCDENITNPSNPPLDRSLLSSSSAAPADMVGSIANLQAGTSTVTLSPFVQGAINDSTGVIDNTDTSKCHIGKLTMSAGDTITYTRYNSNITYSQKLFLYNSNGTYSSSVDLSPGDTYTFASDGQYAVRCGKNGTATLEDAIAAANQSFTVVKTAMQKIVEVVNTLDGIRVATSGDVGKAVVVKTVNDGKITETKFIEVPQFKVPGTEYTIDIKATGSTGTATSIWGLTPVDDEPYYVKNVSLKVKAETEVSVYLAEKLSSSSFKVLSKAGTIPAEIADGYNSFAPAFPVRVEPGQFLLVTFSKNSVFYQAGSGLANDYLYDVSRSSVAENTTYSGDTLYWGSYALCSEIVYAQETDGDLTTDINDIMKDVAENGKEIDNLQETTDSLVKHPYVSVFFDNFNSSNSDWVDSDSAWTFDYTDQTVESTAAGDVRAGTNCLVLNRKYISDKRLMSFRVMFASDTVLDIGFRNADGSYDGNNKVTIDIGNQQIKLYDMYKAATSTYPLLVTKDISSFTIDTSKWYIVRVERHNLVATVEIQDYITGESISVDYTFSNGFFFQELYTLAKVSGGNVTIKDFDVSIMNDPLIYIVGDSITAYACEVGGWINKFNKDLSNRIVASGRGNDSEASISTLFDTEVKHIKPKVLMWCHGHNGTGITAQTLSDVQTLCDSIGCKMYVNHITCMRDDLQITRNAVVDAAGYRGAKFDIATARDGNPDIVPGDSELRKDPSLYMDSEHPNLAGNQKMYERLRIDVPELFLQ